MFLRIMGYTRVLMFRMKATPPGYDFCSREARLSTPLINELLLDDFVIELFIRDVWR